MERWTCSGLVWSCHNAIGRVDILLCRTTERGCGKTASPCRCFCGRGRAGQALTYLQTQLPVVGNLTTTATGTPPGSRRVVKGNAFTSNCFHPAPSASPRVGEFHRDADSELWSRVCDGRWIAASGRTVDPTILRNRGLEYRAQDLKYRLPLVALHSR
jgi:hypothetical protein